MTTNRGFDGELEEWLDAKASGKGPAGIHAAAMQRASGSRQRPAWLVGLRGDAYPSRAGLSGHPVLAAALVVLAMALIVVAAAVAGAFRSQRPTLGANGAIAYSVWENKSRAGQTSFTYLIRGDGSANERIATGTCPTFSADGTVMTYESHWAGGDLIAAAADGSSPRTLPITVDPQFRDNGHAVSPDGTQVAWFKSISRIEFPEPDGGAIGTGSRNELWVTPVAGGPGVRIVPVSDVPTESFWLPVWSPDGTTIAFEGRVGQPAAEGPGYRRAIYLVGASGGDVRRLTTRPLVSWGTYGLAWSPDGHSIAYLGLPDGSPLPSGPVDEAHPDVPPDLFLIGADGTGERQLTSTSAFESRPGWSPDGTRLGYLRSEEGETYELMVLPMADRIPAGSPVRGPASDAFAWSPDGTTLLSLDGTTIRSVDAGLTRLPVTMVDLGTWPQPDPVFHATYSTDINRCPPSWQWLRP